MVCINPILFSPPPSPPSPHVRSIRSVMQKYLEERDELTFDKIFNQKIGKFEHFYPLYRQGSNFHSEEQLPALGCIPPGDRKNHSSPGRVKRMTRHFFLLSVQTEIF